MILGDELFNRSKILEVGNSEPWVNASGDSVVDVLGTSGIGTMKRGDGTTPTTFPTYSRDGLWSFDGGDYFNCGDNDAFSFTLADKFSIGCFFILNAISGSYGLINKQRNNLVNGEYGVYHSSIAPGAIRFVFSDDALSGCRYVQSNQKVVALVLHSLVLTYNGSGNVTTADMKIFINGDDETASNSGAGSFSSVQNTTEPLVFGGFSNIATFATGKIGYPFIAPYQMSQQQIRYWDAVTRRRMGMRL